MKYNKEDVMSICRQLKLDELYLYPSDSDVLMFIIPRELPYPMKMHITNKFREKLRVKCAVLFTEGKVKEEYLIIKDSKWVV